MTKIVIIGKNNISKLIVFKVILLYFENFKKSLKFIIVNFIVNFG